MVEQFSSYRNSCVFSGKIYNANVGRSYIVALADQIRKSRCEQGLSLSELARRSKVSKGYLSQLENSPNGPRPSAELLYRIAFALGTSIGTLLEKQIVKTQYELT